MTLEKINAEDAGTSQFPAERDKGNDTEQNKQEAPLMDLFTCSDQQHSKLSALGVV